MLKLKLCLFAVIFSVYLLFSSGHPWIEADYELKTAKQLITNHSFSYEEEKPCTMKGMNGRYYDLHETANVIVLLPFAWLEKIIPTSEKNQAQAISFLASLSGTLISALAALIFFSLLQLWRLPLKNCLSATFCLSFLTILFPYATKNYEGNVLMLIMLGTLFFLFRFLTRPALSTLVMCGVLAGLSFHVRNSALIFFGCISVFVILYSCKTKRVSTFSTFFLSALPFILLWCYYNWLRTGVPYLSPQMQEILFARSSHIHANSTLARGLYILLASSGGSIFIYSPILLFALLGWKDFIRSRSQEALLVLSIVACFILSNAKLSDPFGLSGWGPRYTLEITPLLMLPFAYIFTDKCSRYAYKRLFFIFLCIPSIAIQCASTLVNWHNRLGYVTAQKGIDAIWFTARYSQWWDSIKTLCINLWNMLFGFLHPLAANPGYDLSMSKESQYMSYTLFTWWNRLLYMGFNPLWIWCYVGLTMGTIFLCVRYIKKYVREQSMYDARPA
jgi:hypothetical protein